MASLAEPVVRAARDADVERVSELWLAMYAFQHANGMMLPLRDDAREVWRTQQAGRLDTPVSTLLVAELPDGSVGGFLAAQVKRLPAHLATGTGKVGFVSEVFVDPVERRHRVGRALVDAAFAWFDRAGCGSVELQVVAGNATARAFWEAMGFSVELVQMRAKRSR